MIQHNLGKLAFASIAAALIAGMASNSAVATPIAVQITPVAIYHSATSAFGLAYDSGNDLIHYTQGDSGDSLIHTLKPFNSYTAAQLAPITLSGGVYQISLAQGQHDVAGTTNPTSGAHFNSLSYDTSTGQLVMQGTGSNLQSFDPLTGANNNNAYAPGNAASSFSDGLDVTGANVWWSGDVQSIRKNGLELIGASTAIPVWSGIGPGTPKNTLGFSGVEQIGSSVWAVAVMSGSDAGQSRTIVSFDALTGALLTYDPDGDNVAARWEDMTFDGRYLYAADLRGNADGLGSNGDIYVFDMIGPGGGSVIVVPVKASEPGTFALFGLALAGLGVMRRRKRMAA